jgi:hypothetical protein
MSQTLKECHSGHRGTTGVVRPMLLEKARDPKQSSEAPVSGLSNGDARTAAGCIGSGSDRPWVCVALTSLCLFPYL